MLSMPASREASRHQTLQPERVIVGGDFDALDREE
jgi:hypothetical protein